MVGLGDRHVQSILIDCNTAELVHIDLGRCGTPPELGGGGGRVGWLCGWAMGQTCTEYFDWLQHSRGGPH